MHDLKFLRNHRERVEAGVALKGMTVDLGRFYGIEERRLDLLHESEQLKARRNAVTQEVGALRQSGQPADELIRQSRQLGDRIKELDVELKTLEEQSAELAAWIPNLPHETTPPGRDATQNQVVRAWGEPPAFGFEPQPHWDLATGLGLLDFARAPRIAGAGFLLFTGRGARLERALVNFMLDLHTTRHGYVEVSPPHVVRRAALFGTGQLPKLEGDMYHIGEDDLFLNPTAEVPVTNIYRDEILEPGVVPVNLTAYCASYRREAGAYGADTRGMVRVHQFDKVELVKIVPPATSYEEHERLARDVADVFEALELPYRQVLLCSGDLSLRRRQVLRLRGLGAGREGLARVLVVLELRGLPGAPHEPALPPRGGRQGRAPAHAERLRGGAAPHLRGAAREPPDRRGHGARPGGAASVPRRPRGDRGRGVMSGPPPAMPRFRRTGGYVLRATAFVGSLLLVVSVFLFTQQTIRRLTTEVQTTSRLLARFLAAATWQAARDPELQRITREVIGNLDFPVIITDVEGFPRAWRKTPVHPDLVPVASIDSLRDSLPLSPVIRARIEQLQAEVVRLDRLNPPVPMTQLFTDVPLGAVHYGEPAALGLLRWMPYATVTGVLLLLGLGFWGLASLRSAEKRTIWVGMARETAHQLGTPLSSLMGWVELLRGHAEAAPAGVDGGRAADRAGGDARPRWSATWTASTRWRSASVTSARPRTCSSRRWRRWCARRCSTCAGGCRTTRAASCCASATRRCRPSTSTPSWSSGRSRTCW